MPNKHKDLPSGSQAWADELDAALATIKKLEEVVRRLSENAGIDYSNPKRGLNPVNEMPSTNNPVGQKLSSLADVQIYNVADKQVLNWSNKDQKWLPVTLPTPTAGGTVDISGVSYSGLAEGYGTVDQPNGDWAYTATGLIGGVGFADGFTEIWASDYVYIGAGDYRADYGFLGFIEVNNGNVVLNAQNFNTGVESRISISPDAVDIQSGYVILPRVATADRPAASYSKRGACLFDTDLGIPIICNGSSWTNFTGTAV